MLYKGKQAFMLACFMCFTAPCLLFACTMSPSVWKSLEQTEEATEAPSAYALSEAFFQLKAGFERECRAAGFAVKPLVFASMLCENEDKVSLEAYNNIVKALGTVWNDAEILPFDKLKGPYEGLNRSDCHAVSIVISNSKTALIHMIDLNPQVYELLRFVIRDETSVFFRVADSEHLPVFLDEISVSPTIIIDPLISPWGGFLIRVEKNNSAPLAVDFGSIDDNQSHVMRINFGFNQPQGAPPMKEFRTELLNKVELSAKNEKLCASLIYAIQGLDYELFQLFFEAYPKFDINTRAQNGYTPLHCAVAAGSAKMTNDLLNKGADINILTPQGETVLSIALKAGRADVIAVLGSHANSTAIKAKPKALAPQKAH